MRLPSSKIYAFWLAILRLYAGLFWLLHGVPKFTQSQMFMPPNGFIVDFINKGITLTSGPYHDFLANYVLPNIGLFAELVRLGEVVAGALLVFGLFTRFGGFIGMLLALNYMAAKGGLDHASSWSELDALAFVLSAVNFVLPTGRFLGVDSLFGMRKSPRIAATSAAPTASGVHAEFVEEPPMTGPSAPTS